MKLATLLLALTLSANAQFVIPDGTTYVGIHSYRQDLTNVIIPDSVTEISSDAFFFCTNITRITVGRGAQTIGACAFACAGYTAHSFSVVFMGNAPTNIDRYAFYDDSPMGWMPNNVTVYAHPGTTGWSNTLAGRPVWFIPTITKPHVETSEFVPAPFNKFTVENVNTNMVFVVEVSADMASWNQLATTLGPVRNRTGHVDVVDYDYSPSRFYRVKLLAPQ